MARLNITLPDEVAERIADKYNKSRYIAEALVEKLDREERERIELGLREGYIARKEENSKLIDDWKYADMETWD